MNYTYYIEGFPVPFHDLMEVFEFLSSLSVKMLYMFSCSLVLCENIPVMWIIVGEEKIGGTTLLSYREFPRKI